MFDSVLGRGQGPKSRLFLGVVLSVVLHISVFVLVVSLPPRSAQEKREEDEVVVTFMQAAAPPLAGMPSLSLPPAHKKSAARRPVKKRPDVSVRPRVRPHEKPPEVEPEPSAEEEDGDVEEDEGGLEGDVPGDVIGGVVGGAVGGVIGGVPGGQVGGTGVEVLPFGAGMTRPRKLSGPKPQYTREALQARVQGLMIIKCVITTRGTVERCRIIKSLPHMEQAVLEALHAQRYQPVTFQGRPVPVDYTFNIRLVLPSR
ncbi:energy transducer TonB [Pyxidicoccus fallax]|uniref:Energy transducer TonB n=1 Tax=Pyxidicoccus fallax TaxID=394095 RepID=A0A848LE17_9BACT|nr:energy transducer TonB [Pyxidicoccus fallax]NMO16947.1 energy transducer TonB [Pyxidicoccus fallax]NPC81435.1 energy transducer TonB [Pyxidicoccus fallax]